MNTTKLVIKIVTRGDDLGQATPDGFRYVDEMFSEAGLRDGLGVKEAEAEGRRLRVLQRGLQRELNQPVVLHVVNIWSLDGLWLVVRYRLRDFPRVLIGGEAYPLDTPLTELVEAVRRTLT